MSHSHHHSSPDAGGGLLDLLELDAEVLHDYWAAALDWVARAAGDTTRLLDLGAGTGTGAIGLAQRFPAAEVLAVDSSAESLHRLSHQARELGLAERVHPIEADLDADWPEFGVLDLTWASMSLHHLADPGQALRRLRELTRPGGLIAVAEFVEPVRFLPEDLDLGRPGFEDRVIAARNLTHQETMPTLGSAWSPRLTGAGWQVFDERDFAIDLRPAARTNAGRYAEAWFSRLRQGMADQLDPDDLSTLDTLLDPDDSRSVLLRPDLHLHGIRTVTLARNA